MGKSSLSSRRTFLRTLLASGLTTPALQALAQDQSAPHILLRSGWQPINIGDVAHTLGALRLLQQYVPAAKITVWLASANDGVDAMLRRNFPDVTFLHGGLDTDGTPTNKQLQHAFQSASLVLHGSGPSIVSPPALNYARRLAKPYGIYGVTLSDRDLALHDLLPHAAFLFCRDTQSLDALKQSGLAPPQTGFAPDAAFAFDLRDDARAQTFLQSQALEPGKFICAVPRLRYTPYYRIHNRKPTAEDLRRDAVNDKFSEPDHAKLREAMTAYVRKTGNKVLVCPEMTYAIDTGKTLLIDPLPDDVKKNTAHRNTFWLPDEAASVYAKAAAVVSFEMHSPILALAAGTPAIYLRQPTDTRKGQMMRDIGLPDWIFEIDQTPAPTLAETLLAIISDRDAARKKLATAMDFVHQRQKDTMSIVANAATAPHP